MDTCVMLLPQRRYNTVHVRARNAAQGLHQQHQRALFLLWGRVTRTERQKNTDQCQQCNGALRSATCQLARPTMPHSATYHVPDNFRFSQPRREAAMSMQ